MDFLKNLFGKKSTVPQSNKGQNQFSTISSFEVDQIAEEAGEMYFQCPNCGAYERVNNIGKMMMKSDPTYFTEINCMECNHSYNARVRIKKGTCPE